VTALGLRRGKSKIIAGEVEIEIPGRIKGPGSLGKKRNREGNYLVAGSMDVEGVEFESHRGISTKGGGD